MTTVSTDCIPEQLQFQKVNTLPLTVNFQGEAVTSDAGLTLIAELDRRREITSRLALCFKNYREPNRIEHSVNALIAQRVYGLVMGYEDINDHDQLRQALVHICDIFPQVSPLSIPCHLNPYIIIYLALPYFLNIRPESLHFD